MKAIRSVNATRCSLLIITAVGLALAIGAECPVQTFVFRGRVVGRAGVPVVGATISCDLDRDSFPDQAVTDARGSFVLSVSRDTHAGTSCRGGDKCRPAESVIIKVLSRQSLAKREFAIRELGATGQQNEDDVEIPTIQLP